MWSRVKFNHKKLPGSGISQDCHWSELTSTTGHQSSDFTALSKAVLNVNTTLSMVPPLWSAWPNNIWGTQVLWLWHPFHSRWFFMNENWRQIQLSIPRYSICSAHRQPSVITDGSGMICRTIGRTITFSQVGFPAINRRPRSNPVPMFVRYRRHQLRSAPAPSIWAMGFHPSHRPRFALWAQIRAISWHPPHRPRPARGLSRRRNKVNRCHDDKFRRETAQIETINSINLWKLNPIGKTL
jgi:hypothetical protein